MSRQEKNLMQSHLEEADPANFATGYRNTTHEFDSTQRRSARLAKRQQRTGRHRAACRQEESKEIARQVMAKMRSKLRANKKEVLEAMEEEPLVGVGHARPRTPTGRMTPNPPRFLPSYAKLPRLQSRS